MRMSGKLESSVFWPRELRICIYKTSDACAQNSFIVYSHAVTASTTIDIPIPPSLNERSLASAFCSTYGNGNFQRGESNNGRFQPYNRFPCLMRVHVANYCLIPLKACLHYICQQTHPTFAKILSNGYPAEFISRLVHLF